ncbi:CbtA family protein [Azospirillum canadense]|uniref:CbtA family protein n=1 Tax=Azospirillum canadense TaxID=403962 RepID=UPI002226F027|nr:CbtA family protein [Azospirillum canadense]MCW2240437.1 cobalt transporter subunit CbtA [Azospirillum canadense]
MELFRRLFIAALCAGTLSGVVITAAHQFGTVPVILEAEVYEKAAEAHGHPGVAHEHADHNAATMEKAAAHDPEAEAWEPADGFERTLYTGLADILTGIGFALLLVSAYAVKGDAMTWRRGLFWGLAGFATFTLAPTLGLPPEVPGTAAAPLLDRQVWWIATVALTGGGLGLLAFKREAIWAVLAVAMIVLPHVIGAPQPVESGSAAPEALAHRFVVAAMVVSLLFWISLGASTGYLYRRFVQNT